MCVPRPPSQPLDCPSSPPTQTANCNMAGSATDVAEKSERGRILGAGSQHVEASLAGHAEKNCAGNRPQEEEPRR